MNCEKKKKKRVRTPLLCFCGQKRGGARLRFNRSTLLLLPSSSPGRTPFGTPLPLSRRTAIALRLGVGLEYGLGLAVRVRVRVVLSVRVSVVRVGVDALQDRGASCLFLNTTSHFRSLVS